jgi:hypothetical protein
LSDTENTVEATLCGKPLHGLMHVCAFVDSRDEQYAILLPYLRDGLRRNAHLSCMVGEVNLLDYVTRMQRDGMNVERLIGESRLSVSTAEQVFPRDGSGTPSSILAHSEAGIDAAHAAGCDSVRGFREMDWALTALRRGEELLEYEARVNFLALKMIEPVVCVYDINRVSGSLLMEILCAHPKAIIGGVLHENPYFVSPKAYLKRLTERAGKHKRVPERRASVLQL